MCLLHTGAQVGLQGAGALGYNAVKGAVTGAEQLISNTINTYQQIQVRPLQVVTGYSWL
jgi:hypothetical protein